ncbi:hypothetical protein T01_12176 [Trichinella spiralis]|uniref:Uncharacterized protein n=1 Tax=Trichinella spiralis TaxID=6334 RepID=A0A0V1AZA7_TRISP|nr:hypothetical protein T01_12176 [Trichinella spiralis]
MIWFGKCPGEKPNTYPTTGASQNTSLNHPIGSSDGRVLRSPLVARFIAMSAVMHMVNSNIQISVTEAIEDSI